MNKNLRSLWDITKDLTFVLLEDLKGREKQGGAEKVPEEEIWLKNFSNLAEDISLPTQT